VIAKYLNGETWGYIDNIRQAASVGLDIRQTVTNYDEERNFKEKEAREKGWPVEFDICCYADGEEFPDEVKISNKVFLKATEGQSQWGHEVHCENLIDGRKWEYPGSIILLYVEGHKEYDTIALITNQKVFLMNDKGQTIERLV